MAAAGLKLRDQWRGAHAGAVQIVKFLLLMGGLMSAAPTSAANLGAIDIDCGTGGLVRVAIAATVGDTYTLNPVSQTTCYVTGAPGVVTWSVAGAPNPPLFDAYTGGAATIKIAAQGTTSWQASQTWGTPPRTNGVVLSISATAATTTAPMSLPGLPRWVQVTLVLLLLVTAAVAGLMTFRAHSDRKRRKAHVGDTNNQDPKTFTIVPPDLAVTKVRPLPSKPRRNNPSTTGRARDQANEGGTAGIPGVRANHTSMEECPAVVNKPATQVPSLAAGVGTTTSVSQLASEAKTVRADLVSNGETAKVEVADKQAATAKPTQ